MADESFLNKELRQVALNVFSTSGGITALMPLRSRMLQEMNGAVFAAYIAKHRSPPSPTEIQRMRQLVLDIWDDIVNTALLTDFQDENSDSTASEKRC